MFEAGDHSADMSLNAATRYQAKHGVSTKVHAYEHGHRQCLIARHTMQHGKDTQVRHWCSELQIPALTTSYASPISPAELGSSMRRESDSLQSQL